MLRLVVLVVALAAGTGAAQPRYTVTVIGSASQRPGAGPVSAPLAVNRDGRVVGYAGAPGGLIEAMDWRGGVFSSPCGAGAFVQTSAMAVNNSGLMVGSGWLAGHQTRAVAWSGGLVWDLGGLGGQQACRGSRACGRSFTGRG